MPHCGDATPERGGVPEKQKSGDCGQHAHHSAVSRVASELSLVSLTAISLSGNVEESASSCLRVFSSVGWTGERQTSLFGPGLPSFPLRV